MESRFRHLILGASAALLALPTFASPVGTLSITNVATGGVTVSATRIDWFPPGNPVPGAAGVGDFATGAPTNITYSGGVVTSATNPYGQIKDIDIASGPIVNFLQFYVGLTIPTPPGTGALQPYPVFDLNTVNPGGSAQGALNDCAGVTGIGVSCSPLIDLGGGVTFVSPFVLTNRGAYTDVSLGVSMTARDATGSVPWAGGFTTQLTDQAGVRLTPDAIQTIINGGGSITNTYSGTFIGTVVPEPATYAFLGSGLMMLGLLGRRMRKQQK